MQLSSYSGKKIPVAGKVEVIVSYQSLRHPLPSLRVHDQLWPELALGNSSGNSQPASNDTGVSVAGHQARLEGLGTLQGHKVRIIADSEATPRFCKACSVPYALRDKANAELSRLVEGGTLVPLQFSEWAAPIVVVLKGDKSSIHICRDFKQIVNSMSKLDKYPILKVEDPFATLAVGREFSKISLSQVYQQLPLDEESQKLAVINTQKGLFKYTRLPFGISSAPRICQRVMESILQGIMGVIAYLEELLQWTNTFRS